MADKKLTKKELKAPDAFQRVGNEAGDWIKARTKLVAIAVAVLLIGGAAIAIGAYFNTRSEERAASELGLALKMLERPVVEGTPENLPADVKDPPFRSEKEKDAAVIQALTGFRDGHKGTRAAITAALPLAQAELRSGQADSAAAHFTEYVKDTPADWPLRATALEGQGYAFEAKGQLDQAMGAFSELSKETHGDFLIGMGQYHHARLLIAQGKKDDAARELAQLAGEHPNSAAARMATERLAVLASEGIKTPAITPKTDAG